MSKTWECGMCGRNNPPHRLKCQTWNREREPKKMVDTGIVDVDASPTLPHDRDAVDVEAAKLHAQLGQDAVDVPMMENGPDEVPPEEAEREQLRTLLANLDASIAAPTPVAAGDEDVYEILQAKQGKRKRVQAQLSALGPLKTRPRAAQEAHDKANKKYKALGGGSP